MEFDFGGVNDLMKPNKYIEHMMGDGRKVKIYFNAEGNKTKVTETLEAEDSNPIEMQKEAGRHPG